jgi:hypothetical protein
VIPGARLPDRMSAARDQLARAAEADNPGWEIRHHLRGWTGTRTRDQRAETASSLPGLLALISIAGTDRPSGTGPPGAAS